MPAGRPQGSGQETARESRSVPKGKQTAPRGPRAGCPHLRLGEAPNAPPAPRRLIGTLWPNTLGPAAEQNHPPRQPNVSWA